MTGSFAGKAVLVTGAASGIGRATAQWMAEQGGDVLAIDIQEAEYSDKRIVTLCADTGREAEVERVVSTAMDRFGKIDIAVANAGISGGMAGIFDQDETAWAHVLRINLIGSFLMIKHAAHIMVEAGRPGSIVCTASVAGLRAGAGGMAYSASKAGVINLVQTAAQQLSGSGVRVNAVCPGLIETGMTRDVYDAARTKGQESAIGQLNPLRRGGDAMEIAKAIAFLASDEAAYINGHALLVDGGLASSLPFSRPPRLGVARF